MSDDKYHLTYNVVPHPEAIKKEDVPEGWGACDSLLLVSVIEPEDGGLSVASVSINGKTGEPLEPDQVWKLWCILAHALSNNAVLSEPKRALCLEVHNVVKEAILASREEKEDESEGS